MDHVKIETDYSALEPHQFFEILKSDSSKIDEDSLKEQLDLLAREMHTARSLGQNDYFEKLKFNRDCIVKENILIKSGYTKFINKTDLNKFIISVKPEGSVKIIELEKFTRHIPFEHSEKILNAKNLNVFSDIVIVFTDLNNNVNRSKKDEEYIKRNRDPIAFGIFRDKGVFKKDKKTIHQKSGDAYERLYFITDWEDEYCHLTFDAMLGQMMKDNVYAGILESPRNFITDYKEQEKKSWMTKLTSPWKRFFQGN